MQDKQGVVGRGASASFSYVTVILHWWVAFGIIGLLFVGIVMSQLSLWSVYPIHKSVGMLMLIPVLLRIIWRVYQGWLPSLSTHQAWEKRLARCVHVCLLTATLLMPLSGMLMSSMSGHGLAVFGVVLFPKHPHPTHPNRVVPINPFLTRIAVNLHFYIGYLMVILLVLHISAALKHHIVDKDRTLKRMLNKQ